MTTRNLLVRLMIAVMLAATGDVALSATATASIPAERTIRVLSAAAVAAASPTDSIWKKAPATEVTLQPAFPGHPSIVGTPVTQRLTAQAMRSGGRLYVRLAWSDATANTAIDDTNKFADGAAVEFPVNGKSDTLPFMGDVEHAVNVWYWRADGRTQNLVAKGFGTATLIPFQGLRSSAVRTESGWAVVLVRPLQVTPDEGVSLQGRRDIPMAFAVWDGDNQERDGLKAVTLEWWQLRF
jgi:complex iron-sulfur molybdoenzyme family reductase subunit gamma